MADCKKCGTKIKARVTINGKERILYKRRYCFICKPFNVNMTRVPKQIEGNLTCQICKKVYTYKKTSNTYTKCGSCCANGKKRNTKIKCVLYKGGKCQKCGYNKSMRALIFHHTDPKQKSFIIAGNHTRSWESLKNELDKCDILCANCHAEEHDKIDDDQSLIP